MNDCKHNLQRNKCHACCEADRDNLRAELARSQEERDALAAQGKRLIALAKLVDKHAIECGCTEELFDRIEKLGVAAIETPETSLTRHDARVAAETVEAAANDLYDTLGLSREQINFLAVRAEQLRRHAEGGSA